MERGITAEIILAAIQSQSESAEKTIPRNGNDCASAPSLLHGRWLGRNRSGLLLDDAVPATLALTMITIRRANSVT